MSCQYQHPDGHRIDYANNILTVTDDNDKSASVPISVYGLWGIAEALKFVYEARQLERAPQVTNYTAADCAEQAGHVIGTNCLEMILAGRSQADAVIQLTKALTDLQTLAHPDRANAGFAAALVSVIEQGLNAAGTGD